VTCIVGLEHDGTVIIGGDAAAVEDTRITRYTDPKVFTVGEYLIGYCDSFRMGQLLQYRLKVPRQITDDDMSHMCTVFVDACRKLFHQGGFAKSSDNEDSGGVFLVGYRGALYCIDEDDHVGRSAHGYEAIGCGEEFALGSLASTTGNAKGRILKALEAAALHSTGVCEPFTVVTG
jgi:ATP-dependent protease HslVU (ClpYQ) peptidase subunit